MSNDEAVSIPATKTSAGRKRLLLGLLGAVVVVTGLATVLHIERQAELSIVTHGRNLAVANGCFACHGTSAYGAP